MEHVGIDIQSVEISNDVINITYVNNQTENFKISYKTMYESWIKNTPMFLTDKYKTTLRNISFAAIQSNQSCINQLDKFFQKGNEKNIQDFLVYMRNRSTKIQNDKSKILK
jgi:hypothetical protein